MIMPEFDEIKSMVADMDTIENFVGDKGVFVGDRFHIPIADLASIIRAALAMSAEEVVKLRDKYKKDVEYLKSIKLTESGDVALYYQEKFVADLESILSKRGGA